MSNTNVLQHWAILDITQILTTTGYKIIVTTNHPVHLWMRWTNRQPWKHIDEFKDRGASVGKDYRICFTVYHNNEQMEPWDTLIHTFLKEPWPFCETRWFYFYGTIEGNDSLSESPIFTKHRTGLFAWSFTELWHAEYEPPNMWCHLAEEWTYFITPPEMELTLVEPWSFETVYIMKRTLTPGGNGAHIFQKDNIWNMSIDGTDTACGYAYPRTIKQGSAARFLNMLIPPNALILYAFIRYHALDDYTRDYVNSYVHAEKSPFPDPLSSIENYFARPRTNAFKDWSPISHWQQDSSYRAPPLTEIIQELVNQPGWASGNPIMIFWEDHIGRSTPNWNTQRRAWQFSATHPEYAPSLHVYYITF